MRAIVTIVRNFKYKTYFGDVLMNGFSKITIAVIDKNGSKKIKSFSKDKIVVYKITAD